MESSGEWEKPADTKAGGNAGRIESVVESCGGGLIELNQTMIADGCCIWHIGTYNTYNTYNTE